MTTATLPSVSPFSPTPPGPMVDRLAALMAAFRSGQSLSLTGVRWEEYEHLLELREQSGIRAEIDYSRGQLEVMTHGNFHERFKGLIGRIVSALCEELQVPMVLAGNCTIRREDLERGFEPDDWFYLGVTAIRMMGPTATRPLDFTTDPPPDLVIEIEITRRLLDRLDFCKAMKIPEVWRFDGKSLNILLLQADGDYATSDCSRSFPSITASAVTDCLTDLATVDDAARLRRFREWVRGLSTN